MTKGGSRLCHYIAADVYHFCSIFSVQPDPCLASGWAPKSPASPTQPDPGSPAQPNLLPQV